jgi:hypothetical protein
VNGHDASGSIRDRRLDLGGVNLKSRSICIDEYRKRVVKQNNVERRNECVGRNDDFVAGTDVEGKE